MEHHGGHQNKGSYKSLALEMAIDFVILYLVMYAMIATLDHFHLNLNNVYMTLMMVAPMSIIMLVAMRAMYIPHHSGAILMCEQAALSDPEIVALCDEIVQAQEAEIAHAGST